MKPAEFCALINRLLHSDESEISTILGRAAGQTRPPDSFVKLAASAITVSRFHASLCQDRHRFVVGAE